MLHCAADNDPYDNNRYEVTLFTGSRRNAGSTAEVSIIITGDNGDSEPRLLQRTSSVSFKRTSQDSYLVTTAYSLGSLQYIRIWHDNTGSDPSWFLSEVIIHDVETGEQYFFLCNSWLACDEGDGLVERLVPVASPDELKDFQYLFMQNSTQGFSDGHFVVFNYSSSSSKSIYTCAASHVLLVYSAVYYVSERNVLQSTSIC